MNFIGFISDNIMLPILDFFYGVVPSYGLAIVALTLVIRSVLYPVSAGQIRNMRRMKVSQPVMQKRQKELQERYKDDPAKLQEEQTKLFKEFGNPLAGCFPLLIQMPILFALFATLRGSPFANVNYTANLKILPQDKIAEVQPETFTTKSQNIFVAEQTHYPVVGILPSGKELGVGQSTDFQFQTIGGKPLQDIIPESEAGNIIPTWTVTKGEDRVSIDENGHIIALQPGDVTIQGTLTGIAAEKGFLFIKALGRVGAVEGEIFTTTDDGAQFNANAIHWDILLMVIGFGVSLYVNQLLSGQGGNDDSGSQQQAMTKYMPVMFSGMFLFFPLPAGVLLYMLLANIFQTVQSYFLSKEPLPENLQKIVDEQERKKAKEERASKVVAEDGERGALPFEPEYSKKKASS
ncbi:membrane protein insertase YidC [Acaryochloris marina]|uniref:membrane protein insertase YidC n=1 Tax=Acaryochloris marina TaxID=155978 RepID=UPI001BAF9AA8|nr:membrane protein insertase YidC [Acaryochloris marina]QUY42602.1 membrane protein insertase YidC [Acaryochloris marina S15]